MSEQSHRGRVGLFWFVEDHRTVCLLGLVVPLDQADCYGDMLAVYTGHAEYWADLAHRGALALRAAGLPTAPVWSEYDEWPRGRVMHDCTCKRFLVRADMQLRRPKFVRIIAERFGIPIQRTLVLADDHYQGARRVPVP